MPKASILLWAELIADDDLREKLGRATRRRLETRFGWRQIANQHVELYRACHQTQEEGSLSTDSYFISVRIPTLGRDSLDRRLAAVAVQTRPAD